MKCRCLQFVPGSGTGGFTHAKPEEKEGENRRGPCSGHGASLGGGLRPRRNRLRRDVHGARVTLTIGRKLQEISRSPFCRFPPIGPWPRKNQRAVEPFVLQ